MSEGNVSNPPLSEAERRDLQWLQEVYQGDHQRQLTWRAVLTGGFLGMFLSISNLYTTLKLGWAFGVAITACVMSYVLWNSFRALTGGRLSQMSMLENNCMQSTASAAGYSTGGTVGSAFAALYLVEGHHQPWWVLAGMVFLTAALGVFLAIPMKRHPAQPLFGGEGGDAQGPRVDLGDRHRRCLRRVEEP
jgi:uncharacterized oligopeptide transporter (OPT) family protein